MVVAIPNTLSPYYSIIEYLGLFPKIVNTSRPVPGSFCLIFGFGDLVGWVLNV
jgi:hypothetical protein